MRSDQPHTPHAREIAGASWDPGQYLKFADHRLRPAVDLMARIPLTDPLRIYDLGCGTGNVTRMLADRWPAAAVVGIDHSPQMLKQARATPARVRWQHGDLADWKPEEAPSLLFSNAVIHWLPDHRSLIGRLWSLLPPGGCLAVQAPMSWDLPSHRLMRETLAGGGARGEPLGGTRLRQATESRGLSDPDFYYDLLAADATHLDVWTTEYLHALTGTDAVLEWVTATSLRPILAGLGDADRVIFLDRYRERLRSAYPPRPDGTTLYPFLRLFFVAVRG